MRVLGLIVFMLGLVSPVQAEMDLGVAPCLPGVADSLVFYPQKGKPIAESNERLLYDLTAEQVEWLGYGPGERAGIEHGFKGIQVNEATPIGYIFLKYQKRYVRWEIEGKEVNRLLVYAYHERYFMSLLTRERYAMPDGTHYDYHIPAHPNGGNCMWWVEAEDWDKVFDG